MKVKLTPYNTPLHQLGRLHPLRASEFERRTPSVLALETELVFRRELGHVRWPLALRFVLAVVGERVVGVIYFEARLRLRGALVVLGGAIVGG